jgi:hypothetical protein
VTIREIPLMEARSFGEKKANNALIAKQLHQTNHSVQFAAKPHNRRGLKVDLSTINPQQGYDGSSSNYTTNQAGKVTFKVKN